jgi:ABC-type antimicrobial peptide transport system permease subunit
MPGRAVLGVALGLLGGLALGPAVRGLLFAITPSDPMAFATTAAVLLATATLSSWLPARRAARTDPARALRSE